MYDHYAVCCVLLSMFNKESRPTITKLVVESADSVGERADSSSDFTSDLARIGVYNVATQSQQRE